MTDQVHRSSSQWVATDEIAKTRRSRVVQVGVVIVVVEVVGSN